MPDSSGLPSNFQPPRQITERHLQLGMYSPSFAHFQKTQPIPQWSFWQQTNTFTWLFSHTQHQNKKYCQLIMKKLHRQCIYYSLKRHTMRGNKNKYLMRLDCKNKIAQWFLDLETQGTIFSSPLNLLPKNFLSESFICPRTISFCGIYYSWNWLYLSTLILSINYLYILHTRTAIVFITEYWFNTKNKQRRK